WRSPSEGVSVQVCETLFNFNLKVNPEARAFCRPRAQDCMHRAQGRAEPRPCVLHRFAETPLQLSIPVERPTFRAPLPRAATLSFTRERSMKPDKAAEASWHLAQTPKEAAFAEF